MEGESTWWDNFSNNLISQCEKEINNIKEENNKKPLETWDLCSDLLNMKIPKTIFTAMESYEEIQKYIENFPTNKEPLKFISHPNNPELYNEEEYRYEEMKNAEIRKMTALNFMLNPYGDPQYGYGLRPEQQVEFNDQPAVVNDRVVRLIPESEEHKRTHMMDDHLGGMQAVFKPGTYYATHDPAKYTHPDDVVDFSDDASVLRAINNAKTGAVPDSEKFTLAPVIENLPNKHAHKWMDEAKEHLLRDYSNPNYIHDMIRESPKLAFIPKPGVAIKSKEEEEDDNYDEMGKRSKEIALQEMEKRKGAGLGIIKNNNTNATRRYREYGPDLPPQERMRRLRAPVMPTIKEENLKAASMYNYGATYMNDTELYDAQRQAILTGKPISGVPMYTFQTPKPEYSRYTPNRGEYRPGIGYYGVAGKPDKDGLPTEWFDDDKRWMIPSLTDYLNGEAPTVYIDGKAKGIANSKQIKEALEKKKKYRAPDPEDGIPTVYMRTIKEDPKTGCRWFEFYDCKKQKQLSPDEIKALADKKRIQYEDAGYASDYKFFAVGTTPYANGADSSSNDSYSDMVTKEFYKSKYSHLSLNMQREAEDYIAKDMIHVGREISRYNLYTGITLEWLKGIMESEDYEDLLAIASDQLFEYRDKDPFALAKSTTFRMSENRWMVISGEGKPTTDKELNEMLEKAKGVYSDMDWKITANILKDSKSNEERLRKLRQIRDLRIIPRKDDKLAKEVNAIVAKATPVQKRNLSNFTLYYTMFRGPFDTNLDDYDERFYEWWMKPRRKMSREEYDTEYSNRMAKFNKERLDDIYKHKDEANAITRREREERLANAFKTVNDYYDSLKSPKLNSSDPVTYFKQINYMMNTEAIRKAAATCDLSKKLGFTSQLFDHDKFSRSIAYADYAYKKGISPLAKEVDRLTSGWEGGEAYSNKHLGIVMPNKNLPPEERRAKYIKDIFKKCKEMPRIHGV